MATLSATRLARPAAFQSRQARRSRVRVVAEVATKQPAKVSIVEKGAYSVVGTARKMNEDRWDVQVPSASQPGDIKLFAGVYDGHGGVAVSDFLSKNLLSYVSKFWSPRDPVAALEDACAEIDERLIQPGGFMGMGERGVGGSKCGSTCANVILYDTAEGSTQLVAFNVGDSRVLLVSGNQVVELSQEHVPDRPEERARIEARNPNPKTPLVVNIAGTWRVGNPWGYLALSRAFGDAFLKAGYTKGLGLVSEPDVLEVPLTGEETYIIISSDGLHFEESRGGGGGMENEQVAEVVAKSGWLSADALAKLLADEAQKLGSTDDVTVVVLKLAKQ